MHLKLRRLISDREKNVAAMSAWTWERTSKHLDLINEQIGWAYKQRNDSGLEVLEEYWQQVVAARCRKLDAESVTPVAASPKKKSTSSPPKSTASSTNSTG